MRVIKARRKKSRRKSRTKRSRTKRNILLMAGRPKMKRRRRKSISRKVRRSVRRSSSGFKMDIANILTTGAIAGVGAVGTVFITNSIAKLVGGMSQQTKNILLVGSAIAAGYLLNKTQFKKYAPAVTTGALVIAMLEIAKTSFGTDLLTVSGFGGNDSIAEIVDNLDLSQVGYSNEGLLGVYETNGLGIIEGESVEEYL